MYIFYTGPNDRYASVGVSKRRGSETSIDTIYLGRVLDKEAGIYNPNFSVFIPVKYGCVITSIPKPSYNKALYRVPLLKQCCKPPRTRV